MGVEESHEFYLLLLSVLAVFFFIIGSELVFYLLLSLTGFALFIFIAYDTLLRPREV